MSRAEAAPIAVAVAVFLTAGTAALTVGPASRTHARPGRVVAAEQPQAIAAQWREAGVRGRLAVVFTRRLNAVEPAPDRSEPRYLEAAMREGLLRTVYHVVPDAAWPQVDANLAAWPSARRTPTGYLLLFFGTRVQVMPLSRLESIPEEALGVLDAAIWSSAELDVIRRKYEEGRLTTDWLAILNGSTGVMDRFAAVAGAGARVTARDP